MRRALVVLIVTVLAAACGKKQPPAAPQSPPPAESTEDADKATGAPDTDATPRSTNADPCDGGENK